jgi:hypothetical protein
MNSFQNQMKYVQIAVLILPMFVQALVTAMVYNPTQEDREMEEITPLVVDTLL